MTICYRDGVLASNRPLYRAPSGNVVALTGEPEECEKFLAAFASIQRGGMPSYMPKVSALIMHGDGEVSFYEDGAVRPVKNEYIARGRGHEWAEGAMGAAADAEEAVEIAQMWRAHYRDNVIVVESEPYVCRRDCDCLHMPGRYSPHVKDFDPVF